jgi:hypothetical protein
MRPLFLSLVAVMSGAGLSQPVLAQVAPEDVWSIYRDFYAATGLEVTAGESRSGDTLTLSDVTATIRLPQDLGVISVIFGPVDLTAQDDGSVVVAYRQPTTARVTAAVGPMREFGADMTLTGSQDGTTVATGTPDAVTVTTQASRVEAALTDLTLTGDPEIEGFDERAVTFAFDIRDTATVTTLTREGDRLTMDVQSISGPSSYLAQVELQDEIGFLSDNSGTTASATYTGRFVLPAAGIDYLDLAASLRAGLSLEATSTAQGMSSLAITADPVGGETRQAGETASSDVRMSLGESGLVLDASTGAATVTYEMPILLPFPIEAALAGSGFGLRVPLLASDTPQDARFALSLTDMVIPDRLVRMLDPSELLPRDPISFELDLSGQVTVLTDLVDVLATGAMIEQGLSPVEPTAVTLESFAVAGAGARLTSSGSFSIDLSDTSFMEGFPFRPAGSAQARATGINGLIDTLVTMGLLAEEDATIGRMGIGMFSQNVGDDTLESSLEVTPEGSILVNGNRIR